MKEVLTIIVLTVMGVIKVLHRLGVGVMLAILLLFFVLGATCLITGVKLLDINMILAGIGLFVMCIAMEYPMMRRLKYLMK